MTIGDSGAFRDDGRSLRQHQVAATLLETRLNTPGVTTVSWLDVACGRGQLVQTLGQAIGHDLLEKLVYVAYDADQAFAREAVRLATDLEFQSVTLRIGTIADLPTILDDDQLFDFITITNAIHEVAPQELPDLLVAVVLRLAEGGTLYVYDAESISPPELGAVSWTGDQFRRLVGRCLAAFAIDDFHPQVPRWQHKTTWCWSLRLEQDHIGRSREELLGLAPQAIQAVRDEVSELLREKQAATREALESLTRYGAETAEEQATKESLLFDYWALSRAAEEMS